MKINTTRFDTSLTATEEDLIQFRKDVIALAEIRGFQISLTTTTEEERENERNIHPLTGQNEEVGDSDA